jgi:hypothetical protein
MPHKGLCKAKFDFFLKIFFDIYVRLRYISVKGFFESRRYYGIFFCQR